MMEKMTSGTPGKLRLLFVCPTALDSEGQPIKQRRLHLPGLTFLILGAITPDDCEIRLVLETVEDIPFDEHWDLVALTGMGSGIVRAWQIADIFRSRGATVILGGIAASLAEPEWSLAHVDSLVIGEAEDLWPLVLADFRAHRLQRIYRMTRPPATEHIPVPRYDLMNKRLLGRWRPVQATRGCPQSCNFCSVSAFFRQEQRQRPPALVLEDIRAARRHGSRHITFMDDNIGVDWEYCAGLWEALIPENITWMSQCSIKIADHEDMLSLAYRSGCRLLSIGIESTSSESLATVKKEWNRPERYLDAINRIRDHGIDVSTEMIIGLDADDPGIFARTYEFILRAGITVPRIHILTPVPGTELFDHLDRQNRITSYDFGKYSGGQVVFKPRLLSAEQLQDGYWALYEKLFSWNGIMKRVLRNRARLNAYMRALVIGTNLHYRDNVRKRIVPGIV